MHRNLGAIRAGVPGYGSVRRVNSPCYGVNPMTASPETLAGVPFVPLSPRQTLQTMRNRAYIIDIKISLKFG